MTKIIVTRQNKAKDTLISNYSLTGICHSCDVNEEAEAHQKKMVIGLHLLVELKITEQIKCS